MRVEGSGAAPRQPSCGLSAPCGARKPPSLSLALNPGQWALSSSDDRGEGLSPGRSETAEMRTVRRGSSKKNRRRKKRGSARWPPNRPLQHKISLLGPKKGARKRTPFLQSPGSKVREKLKRRRWPLNLLLKLRLGRSCAHGRAQLGVRRPPEGKVREPEGGGWHPLAPHGPEDRRRSG